MLAIHRCSWALLYTAAAATAIQPGCCGRHMLRMTTGKRRLLHTPRQLLRPSPPQPAPPFWLCVASVCPQPPGTIVGIITTPLPLGAVAVLGLGVSMLTKTLTFAEAFSAFATEIP